MRFDSLLTLLKIEDDTDESGFPLKRIISQKTVFGKQKSVKRSEFYLAAQSGFSLEQVFEVYTNEYEEHNFVDFKSTRYRVLRSYVKEREKTIELVCQTYSENDQVNGGG